MSTEQIEFATAQERASEAQDRAITSGLDSDWDRYEELRAACHAAGYRFFSTGGSATITQVS